MGSHYGFWGWRWRNWQWRRELLRLLLLLLPTLDDVGIVVALMSVAKLMPMMAKNLKSIIISGFFVRAGVEVIGAELTTKRTRKR